MGGFALHFIGLLGFSSTKDTIMIYYGTEFVDKPTFNESMSDVDYLRYIHYRLTELGDYSYYSHVSRLIVVADAIKRLRAENEMLKSQWQPIETAPMDGSHILLYRPEMRFVGYHCNSGWCINAPGLPIMDPPPTHWMPLPIPPNA